LNDVSQDDFARPYALMFSAAICDVFEEMYLAMFSNTLKVSKLNYQTYNIIMSKQDEKPVIITTTTATTTANTETVLIVNPSSSSGLTGKNWNDFYLKVKGFFGENPEVVFTAKAGDGTSLAREYLERGFKNIVAIGGDGTINEVANGFFIFDGVVKDNNNGAIGSTNSNMLNLPSLNQINPDAVFGIISSGTRNVLAKSLDLPSESFECCKHYGTSKIQNKIDVISATVTNFPDNNDDDNTDNDNNKHPSKLARTRIFLNAAEIGVGAEVIDRSKKIRDKVKSRMVSTVSSVVATLPTYESNLCEFSIDDGRESILAKMTMAVIANGQFLGGGFKAAPKSNMSDGLLDIVILKNSGSFKMLEEFMSMKNGNYTRDDQDIIYMQAKKVSIKPKEQDNKIKIKRGDITVTIDGEPIGILPATFQVYENALTIKM
jgi:diacylglycerol kinase family enzyme